MTTNTSDGVTYVNIEVLVRSQNGVVLDGTSSATVAEVVDGSVREADDRDVLVDAVVRSDTDLHGHALDLLDRLARQLDVTTSDITVDVEEVDGVEVEVVDKPLPPYRDGRMHVMAERCSTCILRPDNSIRDSIGSDRVKAVIQSNLDSNAAPACHHTTFGQDERGEALCRGFVDLYGDRIAGIRLARAMGIITEVQEQDES